MKIKQRKKRRKINGKVPKKFRSNERRSNIIKNVPLMELDDLSILIFFKNNSSLIRRFMVKEKLSFDESIKRIQGALYYVDEADFANHVRLCLKASEGLDHPGERLLSYIIPYIQEKYREFKYYTTPILCKTVDPEPIWKMPKMFLHGCENFYYDFAEDFFINGYSSNQLKDKYGMDTPMYHKALEYLYHNKITPELIQSELSSPQLEPF